MKIIGILGRARAGKDTLANCIFAVAPSNTSFEIWHIASTLKKTIKVLYDLDDDQLTGNTKDMCDPRYGYTPRELCTMWNDNVSRVHGADFFVKRMFREYDVMDTKPNILIPDVRFPHDCDEIRKRNGIIVKIIRHPLPLQVSREDHIDRMSSDLIVYNTHDVRYLYHQVKRDLLPILIKPKVTRST